MVVRWAPRETTTYNVERKYTVSISTNSSGRWRHNYALEGAEGALEKKQGFSGRRVLRAQSEWAVFLAMFSGLAKSKPITLVRNY